MKYMSNRQINLIITRPRGPNLGASVAAGPGSPPKTFILTVYNYFFYLILYLTSVGSTFGGIFKRLR